MSSVASTRTASLSAAGRGRTSSTRLTSITPVAAIRSPSTAGGRVEVEGEQEREEQDVEPAAARLGEPPLQGEEEEQQDGEDRRQVEEAPPRGRDGLRHRDGLVHRPAASTAAAATRSTSSAPRDG